MFAIVVFGAEQVPGGGKCRVGRRRESRLRRLATRCYADSSQQADGDGRANGKRDARYQPKAPGSRATVDDDFHSLLAGKSH